MPEEDNKRYFQYLTTDRRGEILVYNGIEVEEDESYVKFTDGSRCKEDFILPLGEKNARGNTVMAEVEHPNNPWKFKEKWVGRQEEKWSQNANGEKVCVKPFVAGRKKIQLIPPKPPKPRNSKFGGEIVYVNENTGETQKQNEQQENKKEDSQQKSQNQENPENHPKQDQLSHHDPVWLMMDKAKKFDTEVPVSIKISLPTKSLYDVARESFENGGKKVVDYIISNIDDNKLKESLKEALYQAYEDDSSNYESEDDPEGESQYESEDENKESVNEYYEDNNNNKNEQIKEEKKMSPTKPHPEESSKEDSKTTDNNGQTLFQPEVVIASYESEPEMKESEDIENSENNQ